jgi:hypothetical protein
MKKFLPFLSLFIFLGNNSPAQSILVRGGATISNFNNNISETGDADKYETFNRILFNFGAYVDFSLANDLSLETGLQFSRKGNKSESLLIFDGGMLYSEGRRHIDYLDIPLLVKRSFSLSGVEFNVALGGYSGIALSGVASNKGELVLSDPNADVGMDDSMNNPQKISIGKADENGGIKRMDYGLMAGLAANLGSIEIATRYGFGLQNIFLPSPDTEDRGFVLKNRFLQITIGYTF